MTNRADSDLVRTLLAGRTSSKVKLTTNALSYGRGTTKKCREREGMEALEELHVRKGYLVNDVGCMARTVVVTFHGGHQDFCPS